MKYCVSVPYLADPAKYFVAVSDLPWAVWLDSSGRDRYDILTAQPYATLVYKAGSTELQVGAQTQVSTENPIVLLRNLLNEVQVKPNHAIPFSGGAIAYWAYDFMRQSGVRQSSENIPDMAVAIYDWALVIDHVEQSAQLVSNLFQPETKNLLAKILHDLQKDIASIAQPFVVQGEIHSNLSRQEYAQAFKKVIAYLDAGDCYQVNLAQRFSAAATGDALAAYLYLRKICPAPFAAFMKLPNVQVLSVSPERFLRLKDGWVETKPIKGTRPRGNNKQQDAALIADLISNKKDRAENLMIVDLLRNDLGKCCEIGSVTVPQIFQVETHANVHHLVSTVTGKFAESCDALQLLMECFPGGSITGAPKKRAMEIIDEIEPSNRGLYCGAIGYIGFDGYMDTNIAIRSLVYAEGEIRGWAGGGIVADSVCDAEYQETLDKASAILNLLQHFGGELKR